MEEKTTKPKKKKTSTTASRKKKEAKNKTARVSSSKISTRRTKKEAKKTTAKKKTRTANKKLSSKKKTTSKKKTSKKKRIVIKTSKKPSKIKKPVLKKFEGNPIITPNRENEWEAWQTFNPGALLIDEKVHFIYRAIGNDGLSKFGYASSKNGFDIDERSEKAAYEHKLTGLSFCLCSYFSGGSFGGAEDPRLVRIKGEDRIYMTYTVLDGGIGIALTSIDLKDFLKKRWKWKNPVLISPPGEIHKNWVLFPEKINGKYALLHSISPRISIEYLDDLEFKNKRCINSHYNGIPEGEMRNGWEGWIRGVGPPPLKTESGWLVFYHAMELEDFGAYKLGAMLLDLKNPLKIIVKANKPVLEPTEEYEYNGFKSRVVYASGAVIKEDKLMIYYGASDSYVCVAYARLKEFLKQLKEGIRPSLKKKTLRKRKKEYVG